MADSVPRPSQSAAAGLLRGIGASVILTLIVGCRSLGGAGTAPPTLEEPTATPTNSPAPTSETPEPTFQQTEAPSPSPTRDPCDYPGHAPATGSPEFQMSDRFWQTMHAPGQYDFEFQGLQDMTDAVDVIVRGRIVELYIGQEVVRDEGGPASPIAFIGVSLDEVIKGEPNVREDGRIEIRLFTPGSEWDWMLANVPDEEYLFFLLNESGWRQATGRPSRDPDLEAVTYFRPNDQSMLRNIDGHLAVMKALETSCLFGGDRFPLQLNGEPFGEILADVRATIE